MQVFVNQPPILLDHGAKFPKLSAELLSKEPCLTNCSDVGAALQGGILARIGMEHIEGAYVQEIDNAKKAGLSAMVDVRVQELEPGMYPGVPGWHCDCVPRNTLTGQPEFAAVDPHAFSVVVTLSTEPHGVSNTEVVVDAIKPRLYDAEHVYRELHALVERVSPMKQQIKDGVFAKFTPKTIHRAVETHRRGWRMFMRYSMCHRPTIANKVGGQQQIYLLSGTGWN